MTAVEDAINGDPDGSVPGIAAANRRRTRGLALSTALLALTLLAVLTAWFVRASVNPPELRVVEITTPRTADPFSFAISPDGRRLAFVAEHDGQPTVWYEISAPRTGSPLSGTEGARRPFWSPDAARSSSE